MNYLFVIRLKQLYRILLEVGFIRSVFLLGLLVFAIFNLFHLLVEKTWLITCLYMAGIGSIHIGRRDLQLLRSLFSKIVPILFIEYFIVALPLVTGLLIAGKWVEASVASVGIVLIAFSNINSSGFSKLTLTSNTLRIWTFLPFEWISGLRKNWPGIVLLYAAGVGFATYSTAIPLAIIVSVALISGFYIECESYQMIDVYGAPPKIFLIEKFKEHLKMFWIVYLPLLILYLIFNFQYWYVPIIILVVSSTILLLALCLKYASYSPNENLGLNSFIIALSLICFIIPFLAPLPFLLLIRNYRKALKNLEEYLYAYH